MTVFNQSASANAPSTPSVARKSAKPLFVTEGVNDQNVTLTYREQTDASRAANVQGDGRAQPDSSMGFWDATTNLITNGGFESNTTGWAATSGATIARSTADHKFGAACGLVTYSSPQYSGVTSIISSVAASTTYTASIWMNRSESVKILPISIQGTVNGVAGTFIAGVNSQQVTGWQRVTLTFTTPALTTSAFLNIYVQDAAGAAGVTAYIDGVQVEQKPFATPYVETNGGTASRLATENNEQPGLPPTLLNFTQGWVICRMRAGYPSAGGPGSNSRFFSLSADNNNKIFGYLDNASHVVCQRQNPASSSAVSLANTWTNAGDTITAVCAWDAAKVYMTANAQAQQSSTNTFISTLTPLSLEIGHEFRSSPRNLNGDILWIAGGTGTLSNADATTANGWGNTDPTMAQLQALNGGTAAPTFLWTADTAAYTLPTPLPAVMGARSLTKATTIGETTNYRNLLSYSGEQTDTTRAVAFQGDGRAVPDNSIGVWEGTTNLYPNGGFESNVTGWAGFNSATITRDNVHAKFGSWALKVVTPGTVANEGTLYGSAAQSAAAAAATVYTLSMWVYSAAGGENVYIGADEFDGTPTYLRTVGATNLSLVAGWQRLVYTWTTGAGTVTIRPFFRTRSFSTAQAITVWIDGVQVEQKAYATPYVETNGGTITRTASRLFLPSSLLSNSQGWIALRLRMGVSAAGMSGLFLPAFEWRVNGPTRMVVMWNGGGSSWIMDRRLANAPMDAVSAVQSHNAGDIITVIGYWTPTTLGISVNGSAFNTAADARTLVNLSPTFDLLNGGFSSQLDADAFWIAGGTGTLASADAATINGWGSTPPTIAQLQALNGSTAVPTFVWNGPGYIYTGVTAVATQVAKRANKPLSAPISSSAVAVRQAARIISSNVASGTSIARSVAKAITASASTGTSLTRAAARTIAVAAASLTSVARSVGKAVGANVSTTTNVSRATGRAIIAVVSSVASIARSIGKVVAVAAPSTINAAKVAGKVVVAPISATASVSRSVRKAVAALVASVVSVASHLFQRRYGTIALTDYQVTTIALLDVAAATVTFLDAAVTTVEIVDTLV